MKLAGKYFTADDGDTYRTGRVVDDVGGGYFLVHFDNMQDKATPIPMELIHASEMTMTRDGIRAFSFFDTKEKLREWLDWLESPSTAKVVNLVKK